jgi:hypothetical protein
VDGDEIMEEDYEKEIRKEERTRIPKPIEQEMEEAKNRDKE